MAMDLQGGGTSQSPGGLVRSQAAGPHSKVSASTGQGRALESIHLTSSQVLSGCRSEDEILGTTVLQNL